MHKIYTSTSGSLHQLNDFNGFDGCGIFFDNVLEELIGLSVSEPKKNIKNLKYYIKHFF